MTAMPNPFVESDSDNHYQAVIHEAKRAQLAKARAVQEARHLQQEASSSEMTKLIREEEAFRRLQNR